MRKKAHRERKWEERKKIFENSLNKPTQYRSATYPRSKTIKVTSARFKNNKKNTLICFLFLSFFRLSICLFLSSKIFYYAMTTYSFQCSRRFIRQQQQKNELAEAAVIDRHTQSFKSIVWCCLAIQYNYRIRTVHKNKINIFRRLAQESRDKVRETKTRFVSDGVLIFYYFTPRHDDYWNFFCPPSSSSCLSYTHLLPEANELSMSLQRSERARKRKRSLWHIYEWSTYFVACGVCAFRLLLFSCIRISLSFVSYRNASTK